VREWLRIAEQAEWIANQQYRSLEFKSGGQAA
jgi:hypothetical protein